MKVFRVAHLGIVDKAGIPLGPYNASRCLYIDRSAHGYPQDIANDWIALADDIWNALMSMESYSPEPWEDGIPEFIPERHYSGFAYLWDVLNWFHWRALDILESEGFDLLVYDVPDRDVVTGRSQVAARLNRATLLSVEVLSDLSGRL